MQVESLPVTSSFQIKSNSNTNTIKSNEVTKLNDACELNPIQIKEHYFHCDYFYCCWFFFYWKFISDKILNDFLDEHQNRDNKYVKNKMPELDRSVS